MNTVSKHVCIERKNCQPQPVKVEGHWRLTVQGYHLNDLTFCPYCGEALEAESGPTMVEVVNRTGSLSGVMP